MTNPMQYRSPHKNSSSRSYDPLLSINQKISIFSSLVESKRPWFREDEILCGDLYRVRFVMNFCIRHFGIILYQSLANEKNALNQRFLPYTKRFCLRGNF